MNNLVELNHMKIYSSSEPWDFFAGRKKIARGRKNDFFSKLSSLLHIYLSRLNFFVFIKISYLQPFREIMGGQTKRQFSDKNDAAGQKNDFFRFFSSVAHPHIETQLFCFHQNFISSAVQRNHGGTRKSVTSTTNDDDERRTTNYMDDRNTPLGFSASSG